MIGHQMPLLDPAFLLRGEFPEHFPKITPKLTFSVLWRYLRMNTTWYLQSHFA
jgi:hypothetical protein